MLCLQGCLQNSPHECIGSYVVRYSFSGDDDVPRPTKVVRFPPVHLHLHLLLLLLLLHSLQSCWMQLCVHWAFSSVDSSSADEETCTLRAR